MDQGGVPAGGAEEEAHQEGGSDLDGQEQEADGGAVEDGAAGSAQDEGGAGVVAEHEQVFRLGAVAQLFFVQGAHRLRPHRIPTQKPQHQRRSAGPSLVEQPPHDPGQQPPEPGSAAGGDQEGGEDEEGEQGGHHQVPAQQQPVLGRLGGGVWLEQQPGAEG